MPHLSRMLRLQAVAVLVAASVAVAPSEAAAGVSTAREGIEPETLATICEQFQGEFHEHLKSRYPTAASCPTAESTVWKRQSAATSGSTVFRVGAHEVT